MSPDSSDILFCPNFFRDKKDIANSGRNRDKNHKISAPKKPSSSSLSKRKGAKKSKKFAF